MEEALPSSTDPTTWHHMHLLRAIKTKFGKTCAVSNDALSDLTKRLLTGGGVELHHNDSITHIGRHQSQVEAQKAGVGEREIQRACNYDLTAREKHYSVIIPTTWQCQRAAYRIDDQSFCVKFG